VRIGKHALETIAAVGLLSEANWQIQDQWEQSWDASRTAIVAGEPVVLRFAFGSLLFIDGRIMCNNQEDSRLLLLGEEKRTQALM